MDDPSRTLGIRDEGREVEVEEGQEEEGREVASTTTSFGANYISRDPAENRTDDDGRSPLPGDNVNGQSRPLPQDSVNGNNNNGEPAGVANRVEGRVHTEDHERLDSQFRELREMLPPSVGTAAGPRPLLVQQNSSGGAAGQGGGLTADTGMEDEEADLLDRARLRILALEREQMRIAEQNGQLESPTLTLSEITEEIILPMGF